MPDVQVTDDAVLVRLTRREKVLGLLGDVSVPLSAVREVEVLDDGVRAPRGLRAPGLAVPGRIKLGTWRRRHWTQYVAVRRNEPALRLTLTGHRYDSLLVGTPDAQELASRIAASRG